MARRLPRKYRRISLVLASLGVITSYATQQGWFDVAITNIAADQGFTVCLALASAILL